MNTLKVFAGLCALCSLTGLASVSLAETNNEAAQRLLETKTCQGCDLSGQNFTRANLSGADLENANLQDAVFLLADVSEANFTNANLDGAKFSGADMGGAVLTDASVVGADFSGAYVAGIQYKGDLVANSKAGASEPTAEVVEAVAGSTVVASSSSTQKDMSETAHVVSEKEVESPEVAEAGDQVAAQSGSGAAKGVSPAAPVSVAAAATTAVDDEPTFVEENIDGDVEESPEVVVVEEVKPKKKELSPEQVRKNHIKEIVKGGGCYQCDLSGYDFSGKNLRDADFEQCNLTGANFYKARLRTVNFKGADLTNVNFEKADLRGADFYKAKIADAKFEGARIDDALMEQAIEEKQTPFMLMQN